MTTDVKNPIPNSMMTLVFGEDGSTNDWSSAHDVLVAGNNDQVTEVVWPFEQPGYIRALSTQSETAPGSGHDIAFYPVVAGTDKNSDLEAKQADSATTAYAVCDGIEVKQGEKIKCAAKQDASAANGPNMVQAIMFIQTSKNQS